MKVSTQPKNAEEIEPEYWRNSAKFTLGEKLKQTLNTNQAKNIVFFVGDGMGFPTVAATRVHVSAEETKLSFDEFDHVGLASVSQRWFLILS